MFPVSEVQGTFKDYCGLRGINYNRISGVPSQTEVLMAAYAQLVMYSQEAFGRNPLPILPGTERPEDYSRGDDLPDLLGKVNEALSGKSPLLTRLLRSLKPSHAETNYLIRVFEGLLGIETLEGIEMDITLSPEVDAGLAARLGLVPYREAGTGGVSLVELTFGALSCEEHPGFRIMDLSGQNPNLH